MFESFQNDTSLGGAGIFKWFNNVQSGGWSQDGRGMGRGDHFLPNKFIKRSFEC